MTQKQKRGGLHRSTQETQQSQRTSHENDGSVISLSRVRCKCWGPDLVTGCMEELTASPPVQHPHPAAARQHPSPLSTPGFSRGQGPALLGACSKRGFLLGTAVCKTRNLGLRASCYVQGSVVLTQLGSWFCSGRRQSKPSSL